MQHQWQRSIHSLPQHLLNPGWRGTGRLSVADSRQGGRRGGGGGGGGGGWALLWAEGSMALPGDVAQVGQNSQQLHTKATQ